MNPIRLFLILTTLLTVSLLNGCGGSGGTAPVSTDNGRVDGAADSVAVNAIRARAPQAALVDDIDGGVILTRLDVVLDPTASVGQVNSALAQINAKIVTSQPGSPMVTVEVARQADASKLSDIAAQLAQQPGIFAAFSGKEAQTRAIPDFINANPPIDSQSIAFLQDSKFPAAWNAGGLLNDCVANPVNLVIVDKFGSLSSMGAAMRARIAKEFPQYTLKGSVLDDGETHGWNVAAIAAAEYSVSDSTGAMPFSGCLNLTLLSVSGLTYSQQLLTIANYLNTLGSAPAILNYSLGFKDRCDTGCTAASVADGSKLDEFKAITSSSERAWMALQWKSTTHLYWNQLVIVAAAGDEAGQELTQTYRALGVARYNSALSYVADSDFIASTQTNWGADTDPGAGFIQTDSTELAKLRSMESFLASAGVDNAPASNVIMVGQGDGSSSDSGVDVDVPAQKIPNLSGNGLVSGSSFAAPQVSGLAAYLWALDGTGLRDVTNVLSPARVIQVIGDSVTINPVSGEHKLDALAAVLSLDSDAVTEPPSAPVRAAMLDFNDDGFFNQDDITLFANVANLPAAPDPLPQTPNSLFSRFNLHGVDGVDGIQSRGRFDLDVENSTRFGAAKYGTVPLKIGTTTINLDENNLSNTEIVCYYAYSTLYLGDELTRSTLLPLSVCGGDTKIAFGSNRDGNIEIYVMNADGSNPVNLTQNPANDYVPAWSPDGTKVAFMSDRNGAQKIYVMDADGSNLVNPTQNPGYDLNPVWSPNGTKIAFYSTRDGNKEIYVMDADGSNQVNLSQNPAIDDFPVWSPDGTKIAFRSYRDGDFEIYVMNSDGSNQVNLSQNPTITEYDLDPDWSPDGTKIVYRSNRNGNEEIYVMNADGSNQVRLTQNPGREYSLPTWSSDGTKILFASRIRLVGIWDIYVMNADGSSQVNLTQNSSHDSYPVWSP